MRHLIVAAFTSLDGVMQAPGGPDEDTSGGFAYGGWIIPYADGSGEVMDGVFPRPFELLLGRRTYRRHVQRRDQARAVMATTH